MKKVFIPLVLCRRLLRFTGLCRKEVAGLRYAGVNMFSVASIIITLFCISGCSEKIISAKNEITPMELSEEQKEILALISDSANNNSQEILIFDYKTEDTYKDVKFWVEAYEYGKLVKTIDIFNSTTGGDPPIQLNARASIVISQSPDELSFRFSNTERGENGGAITTFTPGETISIIHPEEVHFMRAFGPITDPVTIEPGKDIALYDSIFAENSISTSEAQSYVMEPEQLSLYPYAQLIKCRFE